MTLVDLYDVYGRRLEDAKRFVARCEEKYGISSAEMHDAIDEGRLEETLEVCDWIFEYRLITDHIEATREDDDE